MKLLKKIMVLFIVLTISIIVLPVIIIELNIHYEINKINDKTYAIGQKLYNRINIRRHGCSDYYYLIGDDIKYNNLNESNKLYIAIRNINYDEIIKNGFEDTIPLEKINESYKLIFGVDKEFNDIPKIDAYSTCTKNKKTIICEQELLALCAQAKYSYCPSYIGSYIKNNHLYLLIKVKKQDNFKTPQEKNINNRENVYKATFNLDANNNNWYWVKTKIISKKILEY